MTEYKIGGNLFKEMVVTAANYLEHNKKTLNDLNVFPVPDGDTGTNMSMTLVSAAREVNACAEGCAVSDIVSAMSSGALKGARGNSGVILSQLFRGFADGVKQGAKCLYAEDFTNAMEMGVEAAYKAVMKPKEGTILTVARGMAEEARRQTDKGANLLRVIDAVIEAGEKTLKKTPELLPVLREAGVVDAGGAGLLVIYKGFKMAIDGEEVMHDLDLSMPKPEFSAASRSDISTANIEFGYCTEFFITPLNPDVTEESVDRLRDKLTMIGDSIVVVGDKTLVKVHVHTNVPGKALQYALRLGQLSKVKIDNMREQHSSIMGMEDAKAEQKPIALVAVSAGDGLSGILRDCTVDEIVSGGQSMNPSTQDILTSIEKAPSDHIIVMPNNKNVILAAEQAAEMTEKHVAVIPSKTFPQGLSAVLAYNAESSFEDNVETMREAVGEVKSAEITSAVRDSHVDGLEVAEGEFIGIAEGKITAHGGSIKDVALDMVRGMVGDDDSVISIYYGDGVSEEDAANLSDEMGAAFDDCDAEIYDGKQPVYDYIISVE